MKWWEIGLFSRSFWRKRLNFGVMDLMKEKIFVSLREEAQFWLIFFRNSRYWICLWLNTCLLAECYCRWKVSTMLRPTESFRSLLRNHLALLISTSRVINLSLGCWWVFHSFLRRIVFGVESWDCCNWYSANAQHYSKFVILTWRDFSQYIWLPQTYFSWLLYSGANLPKRKTEWWIDW